jgi:hypothetical protein
MSAVGKMFSATGVRGWAGFGIAGFAVALWSSAGCSDEAPNRAAESLHGPARLTDLSESLPSASPGARASQSSAPESRDPRARDDDPTCTDTCSSKGAECGKVCGDDCGKCPKGEECHDGKCACSSSCDGTLCANACGQACACAAGTACDVSGRCLPSGDCSGPLCTSSPELIDQPVLPGPGDPVPVQR